MNEKQLKEFMNAMGIIAETTLVFYRNLIQAGASTEEAFRLSQAYIGATMFGSGSGQKSQEDKAE